MWAYRTNDYEIKCARNAALAQRKFTMTQVKEIRKLYIQGQTLRALAVQFDTSTTTVRSIVNNASYYEADYKPIMRKPKDYTRSLAVKEVKEIKALYYATHIKIIDIAKKYNTTKSVIKGIVGGRTYRDAKYGFPCKANRYNIRFTEDEKQSIIQWRNDGLTWKQIANKMDLTIGALKSKRNKEAWEHVQVVKD